METLKLKEQHLMLKVKSLVEKDLEEKKDLLKWHKTNYGEDVVTDMTRNNIEDLEEILEAFNEVR